MVRGERGGLRGGLDTVKRKKRDVERVSKFRGWDKKGRLRGDTKVVKGKGKERIKIVLMGWGRSKREAGGGARCWRA